MKKEKQRERQRYTEVVDLRIFCTQMPVIQDADKMLCIRIIRCS